MRLIRSLFKSTIHSGYWKYNQYLQTQLTLNKNCTPRTSPQKLIITLFVSLIKDHKDLQISTTTLHLKPFSFINIMSGP